MTVISTAEVNERIGEALSLSSKADDDPDAAQALVDLLKALQNYHVTTQLLLETQAGKKVRKLTKHGNAAVAQAAAATVSAWREAVTKEAAIGSPAGKSANGSAAATGLSVGSQGSQASEASARPAASSRGADEALTAPATKRQKSVGTELKEAISIQPFQPATSSAAEKIVIPKTGDPARDKTRQLLADGLLLARSAVPRGDAGAAAADVEAAMYRQNGGVNAKYKTKYRSLIFNLRDATNPDLRRRVLSGEISGEVLVNLAAEDLASDARKSENAQIRKTALAEAERGQHMKQASTDQFQCGKCKQRKTQYYQMQTRSADEPMTTFVTCVNCGNRWKFC